MILSKVMAAYDGIHTSDKGRDVRYLLEWKLAGLGHRQCSRILSGADEGWWCSRAGPDVSGCDSTHACLLFLVYLVSRYGVSQVFFVVSSFSTFHGSDGLSKSRRKNGFPIHITFQLPLSYTWSLALETLKPRIYIFWSDLAVIWDEMSQV